MLFSLTIYSPLTDTSPSLSKHIDTRLSPLISHMIWHIYIRLTQEAIFLFGNGSIKPLKPIKISENQRRELEIISEVLRQMKMTFQNNKIYQNLRKKSHLDDISLPEKWQSVKVAF